MLLATVVFWLGRRRYIHVPPGGTAFLKEAFSGEGLRAIGRLALLYCFFAVFWSIYEQNASTWVLQATHMDRNLFGREWLPSQIQVLNPVLVMIYIPVFTYVLYPAIGGRTGAWRSPCLEFPVTCVRLSGRTMKGFLRKLANTWRRMFGQPTEDVNRSRLVGMYLDRTNSKNSLSSEFQQTRQRRNGKFSINRERV